MNQKYTLGFVLGRETALSVAEICAVLEKQMIKYDAELINKEILIVYSTNNSLLGLDINQFGGVIKLFEIIDTTVEKNNLDELVKEKLKPSQTEKRVNFGISGYGQISKRVIWQFGYKIKEDLLDQNIKARFVTGKSLALSSVIVHENKLIERGFEVVLVKNKGLFIVGRTMAVQDYKSYSKRDFGRPHRDDRNGMLPPKLAQIMLNLAQVSHDNILYDPFCGSGTILQEALLASYKNVYGSDINQKQIDDSRDNLNWLEQNYSSKKLEDGHLFIADAMTVNPKFKADAIVSEGFLGEPIRRNIEKAKDDAEKLANFYICVLKNFKTLLKPNGRIVLAIPFFINKNDYTYLPLIDQLNKTGLSIVKPLPEEIKIKLPGRSNLTYRREDQFVGREILILAFQQPDIL